MHKTALNVALYLFLFTHIFFHFLKSRLKYMLRIWLVELLPFDDKWSIFYRVIAVWRQVSIFVSYILARMSYISVKRCPLIISGDALNTSSDLTRPGHELAICRTWCMTANHYTTNAVWYFLMMSILLLYHKYLEYITVAPSYKSTPNAIRTAHIRWIVSLEGNKLVIF